MMSYLLARIIQDTFQKEFWDRPGSAMLLDIKISRLFSEDNKADGEGYRHLQILLTAPTRYVQVWVRETWNLWNTSRTDMAGASPWALAMDHDSGWRDAIRTILQDYEHKTIAWGGPSHMWYEGIPMPSEGFNRAARYARPRS